MKRIIIINNSNWSLKYGIGAYTNNLIKCLLQTEFVFDIVYLNAREYELKVIEKDGYREIYIPTYADPTNKKLPAYCRMIPFLLKEIFYHDDEILFHINFFLSGLLLAQLKTTFRCKILFTVHFTDWGLDLNGDSEKLMSLIDKTQKGKTLSIDEKRTIDSIRTNREIFQQSDLIIFLAHHTMKTYSQISLLLNTHNAIVNTGLKDAYKKTSAIQKQAIRKRYHIKDHETILFFAGWLDEIKGIYCLIEAFQKVLRSKPDAHLFIAGEGDFSKLLAKSRSICTQITFLGFLNKSELYDFYSITDIGIACSIHEEFGLVAVEMMMHRLPVIVTDTGGLAEIIDDQINGLKVPIVYRKGKRTVGINQLAKKICYLIDNPAECKRLGRNARKKFLSDYELSVFGSRLIQIYNSL